MPTHLNDLEMIEKVFTAVSFKVIKSSYSFYIILHFFCEINENNDEEDAAVELL